MIIRIGKCELLQDEVANMSFTELGDTMRACRMTVGERVISGLEKTEWYGRTNDFNYFTNTEMTKNLCGDNVFCLMDSVHRSLMETTKFTHEVYNFVTWYFGVVKDGFISEIARMEGTINFIFSLFPF